MFSTFLKVDIWRPNLKLTLLFLIRGVSMPHLKSSLYGQNFITKLTIYDVNRRILLSNLVIDDPWRMAFLCNTYATQFLHSDDVLLDTDSAVVVKELPFYRRGIGLGQRRKWRSINSYGHQRNQMVQLYAHFETSYLFKFLIFKLSFIETPVTFCIYNIR